MDANRVLTRLLRACWEVWHQDGLLLLRHATQRLTPEQRAFLHLYKAALLAALDDVLAFEERAGIAEYCGGVARDDANRLTWEALRFPVTPEPYTPPVQDWYTALAAVSAWPVQLGRRRPPTLEGECL